MIAPAPLLLSALLLGLVMIGLSVLRRPEARLVQRLVLGAVAVLGALLTLTFFGAILGIPMMLFALAGYVACQIVAGIEGFRARAVAGLIALGLLFAPFAPRIGQEAQLMHSRANYAALWQEAAQHPLAAQIGQYTLSLPWSPQIRVHTVCPPGAPSKPGQCVIAALDPQQGRRGVLRGGPPPAAPGKTAQLAGLELVATDPAGLPELQVVTNLEGGARTSRAEWCKAHPEAAASVWCQAPLARRVLLRPLPISRELSDHLDDDHYYDDYRDAGLAPLPADATASPARFTCSPTRDAVRAREPAQVPFRLCLLRFQPLPGLEARVEFDGLADDALRPAALQVMEQLPPYLRAMGLQP